MEVEGRPAEECRSSLTFSCEPCTLEVILENVVKVAVQDNGPGLELERMKQLLLTPADRRGEGQTFRVKGDPASSGEVRRAPVCLERARGRGHFYHRG